MANGAPRGFRNGKPSGPPPTAGAVDLGALKGLTPEQEDAGQFFAEMESGMRCRGCGLRIGLGFRFHSFKVQVIEGEPTVAHTIKAACSREACEYAQKVHPTAAAVEQVEYAWIDEGGIDKPAPKAITEAEEKRRAKVRAEREAAAAGDKPADDAPAEAAEGNATA